MFPVVSSVALAKRLSGLGADGIVAEGCESGGHIGELTTMALVPQICDAVNVPVIAAGGIAGGRQMAAAFVLGASGVQIGTCLLASDECPIHQNYKEAVVKARDNDTIVTGRIGGAPVRILKNPMAREYVKQEKAGASLMELEKYTRFSAESRCGWRCQEWFFDGRSGQRHGERNSASENNTGEHGKRI